jgi:hypothetical protein
MQQKLAGATDPAQQARIQQRIDWMSRHGGQPQFGQTMGQNIGNAIPGMEDMFQNRPNPVQPNVNQPNWSPMRPGSGFLPDSIAAQAKGQAEGLMQKPLQQGGFAAQAGGQVEGLMQQPMAKDPQMDAISKLIAQWSGK